MDIAASLAFAGALSAAHVERSITFTLDASAGRATRAFGPVEEPRWSPSWQPRFLFPERPKTVRGAVFLIGDNLIWTLREYDEARHVVEYVAIDPKRTLSVITVTVTPLGEARSTATVAYEITALAQAGLARVAQFAEHFTEQRPHWQQTINRYLAGTAEPK